jgi:hypothetical protein
MARWDRSKNKYRELGEEWQGEVAGDQRPVASEEKKEKCLPQR